jgi:hypothetical protein
LAYEYKLFANCLQTVYKLKIMVRIKTWIIYKMNNLKNTFLLFRPKSLMSWVNKLVLSEFGLVLRIS